ncbi:MAG: hypothetical protein WBP54_09250 [Pelodictyon phaeoclathratiforme]
MSKFHQTLIPEEIIAALFCRFNQALDHQCIFAKKGKIVDAGFVEASRHRNTREGKKEVKASSGTSRPTP